MIPEKEHPTKEKGDNSFFLSINPPQQQVQSNTAIDKGTTNTQSNTPYLNELLSYEPPKPTIDPNRPEELRKRALNSSIAKGLNLVGDVVALGKGANVTRRQPDNSERDNMDAMYKYIDDSNGKIDAYEWQKYMAKLRAGQLGLSQYNADRSYAANEAWRDKQAKRWERQDINKDRYNEAQIENMEIDNERQRLADEERARHNRELEKNYQRKPITQKLKVKTDDGIVREFTPEEASFLRGEALNQIDKLAKVYPFLFQVENTNEYDLDKGYKKRYNLAKHTSDSDLIRAFLNFHNSKTVQKGIPGIDYSTRETSDFGNEFVSPVNFQPEQENQYSTGGYY